MTICRYRHIILLYYMTSATVIARDLAAVVRRRAQIAALSLTIAAVMSTAALALRDILAPITSAWHRARPIARAKFAVPMDAAVPAAPAPRARLATLPASAFLRACRQHVCRWANCAVSGTTIAAAR